MSEKDIDYLTETVITSSGNSAEYNSISDLSSKPKMPPQLDGPCQYVRYNPSDSSELYLASNKSLYLYDLDTEKILVYEKLVTGIASWPLHPFFVDYVNNWVCVGSNRDTVTLYHRLSLKKAHEWSAHCGSSIQTVISSKIHEGKRHLYGSSSGTVSVYDIERKKCLEKMMNVGNSISISESVDHGVTFCGGHGRGLRIFNKDYKQIAHLRTPPHPYSSLYFPEANGFFVGGFVDVQFYDIRKLTTNLPLWKSKISRDSLAIVQLQHNPDLCITGENGHHGGGFLKIWDVKKGKCLKNKPCPTQRISIDYYRFDLNSFRAIYSFSKEEDIERLEFLQKFPDVQVELSNKKVRLWKSLTGVREDIVDLKKLSLDVDEDVILRMVGRMKDVEVPLEKLVDYYMLFRNLGMKKEMAQVLGLLRKVKNEEDPIMSLYLLFKKCVQEFEEKDFVNVLDGEKKDKKKKKGSGVEFSCSLSLHIFNKIKQRESVIVGSKFLKKKFSVIIPYLKNFKIRNILKHKDFESGVPKWEEFIKENSKNDGFYNLTLFSSDGIELRTNLQLLILSYNFFYRMLKFDGSELHQLKTKRSINIDVLGEKELVAINNFMINGEFAEKLGFRDFLRLVAHADMYMENRLLSYLVNESSKYSKDEVVNCKELYMLKNPNLQKLLFPSFSGLLPNEELKDYIWLSVDNKKGKRIAELEDRVGTLEKELKMIKELIKSEKKE